MHNHFTTKQTGFTLLELLVAITIFAIMTFMAYGGLSNVIDNSKASEQSLERLREIQLAMFKIERDITQITKRHIRDEQGQSINYILTGNTLAGSSNESLIEFTHNGRRNPAKLRRSHLVRVTYKLEEGHLVRQRWPHLDRVQGMEPHENTLLTKVSNVKIRYLSGTAEWFTQWPPLSTSTNSTPLRLAGIEVTITLEDWGDISRLFNVNL